MWEEDLRKTQIWTIGNPIHPSNFCSQPKKKKFSSDGNQSLKLL